MTDLRELAIALGADPSEIQSFILHGDPVPKGRPRVTRQGHAYTPKRTRDAEEQAVLALRPYGNAPGIVAIDDGPVVFVSRFYRKTRRRCDGDNLQKLLLDASMKAGLFGDDSQVTASVILVEHDPEDPRTELVWGPKK